MTPGLPCRLPPLSSNTHLPLHPGLYHPAQDREQPALGTSQVGASGRWRGLPNSAGSLSATDDGATSTSPSRLWPPLPSSGASTSVDHAARHRTSAQGRGGGRSAISVCGTSGETAQKSVHARALSAPRDHRGGSASVQRTMLRLWPKCVCGPADGWPSACRYQGDAGRAEWMAGRGRTVRPANPRQGMGNWLL